MGKVYEPWPPGLDKADFGVKRFTRIGRRRHRSWISALMRIHDEDDGLFTAAINSGRERISPTRVSTHTHTHIHERVHHAWPTRYHDYRFCSTRCLSCRYERAKSKKPGSFLPSFRPRHLFSIKLEHFVDWIPPWRGGVISGFSEFWISLHFSDSIYLSLCIHVYIRDSIEIHPCSSLKFFVETLYQNSCQILFLLLDVEKEKVTNRFVATCHISEQLKLILVMSV